MLTEDEKKIIKAMEDFHERYPAISRIHWSPNRANCGVSISVPNHHGYNVYADFEMYVACDGGSGIEKDFIRGEIVLKRDSDGLGTALWTQKHHQTVGDALSELKTKWDRFWSNPEFESKFTEFFYLSEQDEEDD